MYALGPGREIIDKYVADGTVHYAFIQFPILGEASVRAAIAAECAANQGKFLEYHDALFEQSQAKGEALFTGEGLVALAGEQGLETTEFSTCLTDDQTVDALRADYAAAIALGVQGTPAIFINDVMYPGARAIEFYTQEIAKALGK